MAKKNDRKEYVIAHRKVIALSFYDKDYPLYYWLKQKPNVTGYIKKLCYQEKNLEETADLGEK